MDLSSFSGLKGILDKKAPDILVAGTAALALYAIYVKMVSALQEKGQVTAADKFRIGSGLAVVGGVIVGVAFPSWKEMGPFSGLGVIKKCPKDRRDPKRPASDQKWCLMDSKGKRLLGRHRTKAGAQRQERGIHIWKRR
tara:strand:- start:1553 stop:1969 length:417 start_codon:yes stop_codon:yes gene_type:complete